MKAVYSLTPMSINGVYGWAITRTIGGTVKYLRRVGIAEVAVWNLPSATSNVQKLTDFENLVPERLWVERDGAHADTKKPMGYRPMQAALYCPAGRHNVGYPH